MTTIDQPTARADILGKLLLIQQVLGVLPDNDGIAAFLRRALDEIPGVTDVHLCVAGVVFPPAGEFAEQCARCEASWSASGNDPACLVGIANTLHAPLRTARGVHGVLILSLGDEVAFSPYLAFVQNIANVVASTIETRQVIAQLDDARAGLEAQVAQRTAALRESEEKFRGLVEATSDWVWEVDADGTYTYASPRVEALLGFTPEEVVGRTPFDLMPPDEARLVAPAFLAARQAHQPLEQVLNTNLHKDGHRVVLETSAIPILDALGNFGGYRGIDRDVTAREAVEAALRESENKFRQVSASAQDAVVLLDQDGRITEWNAAAEGIFGYTAAEVIGRDFHPLVTTERDRDASRRGLQRFREDGTGQLIGNTQELVAHRRDGSEFPIELSVSSVQLHGEWHAVGMVRDITRRKRGEASLRKSEAELGESQRVAHIGSWDWDADSDTIWWSEEYYRIYGLDPETQAASYGGHLAAYTAESAERLDVAVKRAMETGEPYEIDLELAQPTQDTRWIVARGEAKRDETGRIRGLRGTAQNITERKLAEEALRRINRELGAISSCNQTLIRAEDEQALLDDICRIVCDEAGYRMAWVGYAEHDDARGIRPVAWAGAEQGYLQDTRLTWADTERGRGPSGSAIRSGLTIRVDDFETDPQAAPWREKALQRGYRSSIALPLKDERATTFGVLSIYSTQPGAFTASEIALLEELSGDLAFGIMTLRGRAERRKAEDALRQSEERLRLEAERYHSVVSAVSEGIVLQDADGAISACNPSAEAILGRTQDQLVGLTSIDRDSSAIHEDGSPFPGETHPAMVTLSTGEPCSNVIMGLHKPDGALTWISVNSQPLLRTGEPKPYAAVTSFADITERVATEAERSRLLLAVEQIADSVMVTRLDWTILYVNRSFARVYGYEPEEVIGRNAVILSSGRHDASFWEAIRETIAEGRTWSGSIVNRRKDGTVVLVERVISAIHDPVGRLTSYVQADRDVTHERAIEEELATGLRIRAAVAEALVGFRPGQSVPEIAQTICDNVATVPQLDVAALVHFLAEDSAVVVAVNAPPEFPLHAGQALPPERSRYLYRRAKRGPWSARWKARVQDGGYGRAISASGLKAVAYGPILYRGTPVGLLEIGTRHREFAADIVVSGAAVAEFSAASSALLAGPLDALARREREQGELREIIATGAFRPVFQPIQDLETGEVVGYEALTRFADGCRPDLRFESAWSVGLGVALELATLDRAIAAAAGLPGGRWLGVNMSPRLLQIPERVAEVVGRVDRPVVIEVTEHEVIEDYAMIRDAVRGFGPNTRISVDDAGAGVANFAHIIELHPDFVKLDIGLVRGVNVDLGRQALVIAMAHFSRTSGCRLIAEGVETRAEAETLAQLGVNYGQGYWFGHPEPVEAFAPAPVESPG